MTTSTNSLCPFSTCSPSLFQLWAPFWKLCTSHKQTPSNRSCKGLPTTCISSKKKIVTTLKGKPQVSCSLPVRKVRQNLYALDQKELPREMQILLQEVTRFFHSSSHPGETGKTIGNVDIPEAPKGYLLLSLLMFKLRPYHAFRFPRILKEHFLVWNSVGIVSELSQDDVINFLSFAWAPCWIEQPCCMLWNNKSFLPCLFSVFTSHVIKTKNRNRSMN